MDTSYLNCGNNYGNLNNGHRANGFTTAEEAPLIVTAGTAMYSLGAI